MSSSNTHYRRLIDAQRWVFLVALLVAAIGVFLAAAPALADHPGVTLTASRDSGGDSASVSWSAYSGDDFAFYQLVACKKSKYYRTSCSSTVYESNKINSVDSTGPVTVPDLDPHTGYRFILEIWLTDDTSLKVSTKINVLERPQGAPVNPPGPIPAILTDSEGNLYDVFTPEEGGSMVGEGFSFVAKPGDVPSAYIVGINMCERDAASNAGKTHHRYTLGGSYYAVDAVDEFSRTLTRPFNFRNPAVACVPVPAEFRGNIDKLALIATDLDGNTQTVLTSNTRIDSSGLSVCGYLGSVPAVVAAGLQGAPEPLPPTPEAAEESSDLTLPRTGGVAMTRHLAAIVTVFGLALVLAGGLFARSKRVSRHRM